MERWFVIRTKTDFFSIGAENGVIFFAPDRQEWMMGKTLQDVKPYIKENGGWTFELTKEGTVTPLNLIFKIGK